MTRPDPTPFMRQALDLAGEAAAAGDHPYGAVLITAEGTLGERNRVVSSIDPTAHSEVTAIRAAASRWGLDALPGSTLVTSFEPCPMCLGAIMEAGVATLVIGGRRVVGEAPLGDYNAEALLTLMGRSGDITISTGPLAEDVAAFYASVS